MIISSRPQCVDSVYAQLPRWNKKYIVFSIIAGHWWGVSCWKVLSWKKMIHVSHIVHTMAVDDLEKEGARESAPMVSTKFSQNILTSWWHYQIGTFSALLAICVGNSPVNGEFPTQRPVMRSFDVFFDLCLNKRWTKQWWGQWFEIPLHPLWRHCNAASEELELKNNYPFEPMLLTAGLPQTLTDYDWGISKEHSKTKSHIMRTFKGICFTNMLINYFI